MNDPLRRQIEEVQRMTVRDLREKYREVFGEESRSNHRQFLIRRIAWRIQELAEGGLSERARQRALEIANGADRCSRRAIASARPTQSHLVLQVRSTKPQNKEKNQV